jgi:predicted CoA-binding protein
MKETVAILGASDDPSRFAFKAKKMLESYEHKTILVNPKLSSIDGETVYAKVSDIKESVDTLTMYVGAKISDTLIDDILKLHPKRVIFNPGSENLNLENKLKMADIEVVEDCTLVMLQARRF